jgi:hypothetical protein
MKRAASAVRLLQFSAQDPGPRGSPQLPQAPTGAASSPDPAVAKTESFFATSVEWQLGQPGTVFERTSISNSLPHLPQAYS